MRAVTSNTAAEQDGQHPGPLRRLVEQKGASNRRDVFNIWFYRTYPAMMSAVLVGIVGLIGVFVLPKYQAVFHDFGVQLPALTMNLFAVAFTFAPVLLVFVALLIFCTPGRALCAPLAVWRRGHPVFSLSPPFFAPTLPAPPGFSPRGRFSPFGFFSPPLGPLGGCGPFPGRCLNSSVYFPRRRERGYENQPP